MLLKQIRIPKNNVIAIMNELGKLEDSIEFLDLTQNDREAKKNFGPIVNRCDEADKIITNFLDYANIQYDRANNKKIQNFIKEVEEDEKSKAIFGSNYFDFIENEIIEDDRKFKELKEIVNEINDHLDYLYEKYEVLNKTGLLVFDRDNNAIQDNSNEALSLSSRNRKKNLNSMEEGMESDFKFIAGVIKATDEPRMKRMIFRISRGRAFPNFFDFKNKRTGVKIQEQKKVFSIFFQTGIENVLMGKLLNICDIFSASRYEIPTRDKLQNELMLVNNEIDEKIKFCVQSEEAIKHFVHDKIGLNNSGFSKYEMYRYYFKKEKLIYTNLNKCLVRENFIDGDVWIPEKKFELIKEKLDLINHQYEGNFPVSFQEKNFTHLNIKPPTYIKTNTFTESFQEIVNVYGVPRYREINPALFYIVTFPFLFGVMFGDICHGTLLFGFGLFFVINYKDYQSNESYKLIVKLRYLLTMMGFFALFCGILYNDFSSVSMGIFGTCYKTKIDGYWKREDNCVYPFGLDPKWGISGNELMFVNSLKMKLSVIFGIFHMVIGLTLKGVNAVYFGNKLEFVFQFIPQIIFMLLIFGYMIAMIFIKWSSSWAMNLSHAPSLITQMMNILLKFGQVDYPLWSDGKSQYSLQKFIFLTCILCIPVMLIPTPFIIYFKGKKKNQGVVNESLEMRNYNEIVDDVDIHLNQISDHSEHIEDSFSELFIHQSIETIEFVLGSISSTASYLRLWALSLAHVQLSKVMIESTLITFIENPSNTGFLSIFIGYFFFALFTLGILMGMDLLECLLHTLRLHWVEFQNKFYKADGYIFKPFCYKYLFE